MIHDVVCTDCCELAMRRVIPSLLNCLGAVWVDGRDGCIHEWCTCVCVWRYYRARNNQIVYVR